MYVEHVVQHEGLSAVIISDRVPQFSSAFINALALRVGITWNLSTARHSQMVNLSVQTDRPGCPAPLHVPKHE